METETTAARSVIPSITIKLKDARRLGALGLDQIKALDAFAHIG